MGRSVNARTNSNTFLDHAESREADPSEVAAARESDLVPRVLAWGCGAWPLPGQSRAPYGPDAGVNPRNPGAQPYRGPCQGCKGNIRRHHYCLVGDHPKGTLAARVIAAKDRNAKAQARAEKKLKGGKGRVA